jgi:hypothetical protein
VTAALSCRANAAAEEHTVSKAIVAESAAQDGVRHRCRNPRCRCKLKAPADNPHRAFCCRGCYESFYLNRCRVCERDLRKNGKRGDAQRLYCRPPAKCRQEAEKWPEKYANGQLVAFSASKQKSAHSTGLKTRHAGGPSTACHLRGCQWSDSEGDSTLFDDKGLVIVRLVLEDGHYHLRSPVTWPRLSWRELTEAKRGAESIALAAQGLDPKTATRVARDNSTPHPMGSPRAKPPTFGDAIPSDWKPTGTELAPEIPNFLKRVP